jgi:malonate-semialdehyde dehydrogenase (acetylating)/methylmalonate-semialdehyde dehydrogenase
MSAQIPHMIGGQTVAGSPDGRFADVFNPATGKISARVALASQVEVARAIAVAQAAFPAWAATTH